MEVTGASLLGGRFFRLTRARYYPVTQKTIFPRRKTFTLKTILMSYRPDKLDALVYGNSWWALLMLWSWVANHLLHWHKSNSKKLRCEPTYIVLLSELAQLSRVFGNGFRPTLNYRKLSVPLKHLPKFVFSFAKRCFDVITQIENDKCG